MQIQFISDLLQVPDFAFQLTPVISLLLAALLGTILAMHILLLLSLLPLLCSPFCLCTLLLLVFVLGYDVRYLLGYHVRLAAECAGCALFICRYLQARHPFVVRVHLCL